MISCDVINIYFYLFYQLFIIKNQLIKEIIKNDNKDFLKLF